MRKQAVRFHSDEGAELHGDLYRPWQTPIAYAVFAHCFTCASNFKAPVRIARALCRAGFATLAFDFTGLGRSGGEFADTNFTTNVADLVAAARYLNDIHGAGAAVLVGHSLGGTAALAASGDVRSCKAVVTIGAPSSASHIARLLEGARDEIESTGEGLVDIGGRPFRIKKQLLDDVERHGDPERLERLQRALLVMHSPVDAIVPVADASEIFERASHPKSFVSLDDADHLLSREDDAEYAAGVLAAWASRYLDHSPADAPDDEADGAVVASTGSSGFVTAVRAGRHELVADEPVRLGGSDQGPTPYDLVAAGLASCTSMTLQLYARRKGLALETATARVRHSRVHAEDCETGTPKSDRFDRELLLEGDLDAAARQRLLEIAERCPVHRTLAAEAVIATTLPEPEGGQAGDPKPGSTPG